MSMAFSPRYKVYIGTYIGKSCSWTSTVEDETVNK